MCKGVMRAKICEKTKLIQIMRGLTFGNYDLLGIDIIYFPISRPKNFFLAS